MYSTGTMKVEILFLCSISQILVKTVISGGQFEREFVNNLHLTEEESGGILRLRSQGNLSDIVDLDQTECIKRVLCKGQKVLIALKPSVRPVSWKSGQLVIGSSKWQCSNNAINPYSKTIYTKVGEVKYPKDNVIELHTIPAGPLDMLEEATIQVHYEQGRKAPLRHKRYLSNPLRKVLNYVDWNASFVSSIPFNELGTKEDKSLNVFKLPNSTNPQVSFDDDFKYDAKHFLFRCLSCHGHSQISYFFELRIKNVDNKAEIKKYKMQLEVNSTVVQKYDMTTKEEITLTKYASLGQKAPQEIFQTPIAVFKTFPPIMLKVNYKTQENLELSAKLRNATSYTGGFTAHGNTVITQTFEEGRSTVNDVTTYKWTVRANNEYLDANSSVNATFAFFQNTTIVPSISWAQKDVDVNLGPPIHFSIRPRINVLSTSDGTTRCAISSVSIDSNVSVAETDFSIDAFGFQIWNVKLLDRLSRRLDVLQQPLVKKCNADCHGPVQLNNDLTLEEACGESSGNISRGDEIFGRLQQLWGDYILFYSEGTENDSWCGRPGRQCLACFNSTVGYSDDDACATRMVTPALASRLTRLAKFVDAEWKSRKVLVLETWDEPTSVLPVGRYGYNSVFKEGRAAIFTLSRPLSGVSEITTVEAEKDTKILERFSELAVCSKFKRVSKNEADFTTYGCVENVTITHVKKRSLLSRKRRSGEIHHPSVKSILQKVGTSLFSVKGSISLPSELFEGTSYPPGTSMERACGDDTGIVSQDDIESMKRLVQYPLDDVVFSPEGPADTWCGVETRRCQDCSTPVDDESFGEPWNWCGTRTMTMRLATRLHRMAVLTNGQILITKGHTFNITDGMTKLYMEGRAARIEVLPGSPHTLKGLTQYAKIAGFDYVRFSSATFIEICVKLQDGAEAQIVQFPLSTLVAVPLSLNDGEEYAYPSIHAQEPRKPLLFDKTTSSNDISEHFKLHMFLSPGVRYARLDPVLINLLENAYDDFADRFYIIPGSAYRPRSVNRNNLDSRHNNERFRFQMGQAVEIKPSGRVNDDTLFYLAIALMKAGRSVSTMRLGIGIGAKKDRLYFHIRPLTIDTEHEAVDVWDSGNDVLYEKLKDIQDQLMRGGFIITARADEVVCKAPALGVDHFYFGFDLDESGYCWTAHGDFCSETLEHRRNISVKFQISLTSAAGSDKLPRHDIMPEIENCMVTTCGGCPDAGSIWKQKVVQCSQMILKYISRASVPFQPLKDRVSIFNTENAKSTVHSQACHDDRICVENTQIYSLLLPLITATYTHENKEELIFGGADNPSPLLEIVEQELSWRAEGKVDVFIDSLRDVSALRNVLRIIMVLNKNVTEVTYHIDPDIDETDVTSTLQRKLEEWSGSVCPKWSRLVVTPYKIEIIPHERKKRNIERSQERNKMKVSMNNWEVDWILKT